MQEIKIDGLKIIIKIGWLLSSFTANSFLIFLRLLYLNSLHKFNYQILSMQLSNVSLCARINFVNIFFPVKL